MNTSYYHTHTDLVYNKNISSGRVIKPRSLSGNRVLIYRLPHPHEVLVLLCHLNKCINTQTKHLFIYLYLYNLLVSLIYLNPSCSSSLSSKFKTAFFKLFGSCIDQDLR